MSAARRHIPILPQAADPALDACAAAEPFALMVLGDSMEPEFREGEVILVEPEGLATDGSFVLAQLAGEWIFRQLAKQGEAWQLRALDFLHDEFPLKVERRDPFEPSRLRH